MSKPVCHDVPALYRAGATIDEIVRLTGLQKSTIRHRIEMDIRPRPKTPPRKCLCCGRTFASTGPGNRMCARCRARAADVSPYAPDIA